MKKTEKDNKKKPNSNKNPPKNLKFKNLFNNNNNNNKKVKKATKTLKKTSPPFRPNLRNNSNLGGKTENSYLNYRPLIQLLNLNIMKNLILILNLISLLFEGKKPTKKQPTKR
mmetsp:Transcript_21232/g.2856  ORF Transcript_21232/g.2856 Transcript_21232/m.2856 type:complete len:113 (+) Transcript_21232:861-1199(+)